jgi:type IV secretory pathway VirB4 component
MSTPTERLLAARRQDSDAKRQRAWAAFRELVDEGVTVNFETVRRRAGVSRSLVYADPELKARITELRARRGGAGSASPPMPGRSVVSERSLRNDLALAQADNRYLRNELDKLRRRLGMAVAAELDATVGGTNPAAMRSLQDRIAELEDALHDAHQRTRNLEADNADLTETLAASRENYRQLMAQINRPPQQGKSSASQ